VAGLFSMPGMTTSTRCAAGMPSSSARRGSRVGRADSLIKRLTIATIASEAGNSSSSAASTSSHGAPPSACSPANIAPTSAMLPAAMAPR